MTRLPRDLAAAVLEQATTAVVVVDLGGRVRHANAEAARLVGADPVGDHLADLFPGASGDRVQAFLHAVGAGDRDRSAYLRPAPVSWDGRLRWVDLSARPLRDGGFRGAVVSLRDVTEFHDRERELARATLLDGLTGLASRTALLEALGLALRSGTTGVVAFLDVDQFKVVNARFGHPLGDEVLVALGRRLRAAAPRGAFVARLGGDEFVVLWPTAHPDDPAGLVRELLDAASQPAQVLGHEVSITASIGVAVIEGDDVTDVLRRADAAMYRAKAEGGRGWRAYGPDVAVWAQRRDDLAAELEALRAANVRLFDESRRDAGTGLPNLRRLQEDLPAAEAAALASHGSFAIVFVDLDHFGALNKHRGDHAGDDALRRVAGLLAGSLRAGDTVYRKGGEEFVALLPGAGLDVGLRVAERLRAAVQAAGIAHGGVPGVPVVTASVGVAAGPVPGLDVHGVLRAAGDAMLLAKESGRNTVAAAPLAIARP